MNIFGKYIDDNEKVLKSLTKIYGIGRPTARELCMTFGIGLDKKVKDLSKDTWSTLIKAAELGPQKYKDLVKELQESAQSDVNRNYTHTQGGVQDNIFGLGVDTSAINNKEVTDAINLFVLSTAFPDKAQSSDSVLINGKLRSQKVEVRALTDLRERIEAEKKMKSYRGLRHLENLPVRGQRTSTNALTARRRKSKA